MLEHFEVVTNTCLIAGRNADVVLAIAFASGAMTGGLLSAFLRRKKAPESRPLRTPPSASALHAMRGYRRHERRRRRLTRQVESTRPPAPPVEDDALTRAYVKPDGDSLTRTSPQCDDDRTLTMPGMTMDEIRRELDEHRRRR